MSAAVKVPTVKAPKTFANPHDIAHEGQRVYEAAYRAQMEAEHPGEFVAIDVNTGQAYIGRQPEDALNAARKAAPTGLFHLIQVGAPGAYRVSYTSDGHNNWFGR